MFRARLDGYSDGEAPAEGRDDVAYHWVASGDWLSVMGGEFGRLGRR